MYVPSGSAWPPGTSTEYAPVPAAAVAGIVKRSLPSALSTRTVSAATSATRAGWLPSSSPATPSIVGVWSFVSAGGDVTVGSGAVVSTLNVYVTDPPEFPAASFCSACAVYVPSASSWPPATVTAHVLAPASRVAVRVRASVPVVSVPS